MHFGRLFTRRLQVPKFSPLPTDSAYSHVESVYRDQIRHVQETVIYEYVQFGADPNKNMSLVNLNVDSYGDCWSLAAVCTLLSDILVSLFIYPASTEIHNSDKRTCCLFHLQLDDMWVSEQFEILDLSFDLPHDIETADLLSV